MPDGEFLLTEYVLGLPGERRFTQDSPVLPDVWLRFCERPEAPLDLLLVPHKDSSAAELMAALRGRLGPMARDLAYNDGYVVARLTVEQLVAEVVPLSPWWRQLWPPRAKRLGRWLRASNRSLGELSSRGRKGDFRPDWLAWYASLLGAISAARDEERKVERDDEVLEDRWARLAQSGAGFLEEQTRPDPDAATPLWSVTLNRRARTALSRSRLAVKADAAQRLFAISCADVHWAIVDTGIDARHPAFRRRDDKGALRALGAGDAPGDATRVIESYDFTRLRKLISGEIGDASRTERKELEHRIKFGRALDWDAMRPLLTISHGADYRAPARDHGTHVAGIVGADWRADAAPPAPSRQDLLGICPDIGLYDLRVFDPDGEGDEFAVLAALQFVRHLNAQSDLQVIHGVNLSLSLDHDLANYAVGRTPVCDECERLTGSGVVVAVAAGNDGRSRFTSEAGTRSEGFRTVAITDPGNAESVITVGSTHRHDPHTYGVSYFSSRGPTGDGRAKPDLVAPGEKIKAPVPAGGSQLKDGTSQATAHVSGVAALLIARNRELMAQPARVKQVLCATATDLGRERYFQGAGLVDALRALQEV